MIFASQTYKAALNALLAELNCQYIELVPENPFAAKLKHEVITAIRAINRLSSVDEGTWVPIFNLASRVVQLNFVAMALDQLGHVPMPMIVDERWRQVGNPFSLRGIESKLPRAIDYLRRRYGVTIGLRSSKFVIQAWGLEDVEPRSENRGEVSNYFKIELPHSESNTPKDVVQAGAYLLMYYEYPQTIGTVTAGIAAPYKYPQVAVVIEGTEPLLIIRVEENSVGGSMLCAIEPGGRRGNFGPFAATSQDAFLRPRLRELSSQRQAAQERLRKA